MNRRAPVRLALLVALAALALPLVAQEGVAGHWEGEIAIPGQPLALDIDLAQGDDGWTGDISIPVQQITDLALEAIVVEGESVRFTISGVPGSPTFDGTFDGEVISGEFTQGGQSFPFELRRENRAAAAREALEGIDPMIEQALADFGIPGLAIAVVAGDELVMAKGYGLRDIDADLPVTPETLFAIGSTSKAFTAFVLGTLVDEGRLDWDEPVVTYLPDFRLYDAHATQRLKVRDLLIHSSGLPRHDLVWYGADATREELFARLAHLQPTRDLGEEFQYQNLMFMTAGYVAERITGQTWEQLVRERIFEPLEMSRSNFSVEDSKADADHAEPYTVEDRKPRHVPFRNIDAVGPAGSINSSVSEMSQWMRMQLGGGQLAGQRLIESGTLREMHTPHMAISAYPTDQRTFTLGYGLGWSIEAHRGHFLVQHGGGIDGFISWVALLPMENLGVVVYTNAAGANPLPTAVARTVVDRVLGLDDGGYLDRAREALAAAEENAEDAEEVAEERRVDGTSPSHALADYAGDYAHSGYGVVRVALEGEQLALTFNGMSVPLEHWHYDVFRGAREDAELDGTRFQFRMDSDGAITDLVVPFEPAVEPIVFERRPDARLSDPAFLAGLTGEYRLDETRLTIGLRGDRLTLTVAGQPSIVLVPERGTEFSAESLPGYSLEFLLDEGGRARAIRLFQPNGVFEAERVAEE